MIGLYLSLLLDDPDEERGTGLFVAIEVRPVLLDEITLWLLEKCYGLHGFFLLLF